MITSSDKPPIMSSQVDWYSVHLYAQPLLEWIGHWPMAGTLAWRHLDDRDPVKLAAVCDASRHWALRVEAGQEAMAEASQAVRQTADWKAVANRLANRSNVYIPRVKETV